MSAVANGVPQIVGTDEFHARIRCATLVGHKVWCGEEDGTVTVRTPKGWEERRLIRKGACVVTDIAAVGDEAWVGYSDGFIRVYDAQTQAMTKEFCQHEGPVHCMCVHQGHVYTGGADYKIYQWDPATCEFTREYAGHGAPVRCLAVAAMQGLGKKQYTLLVSGADDGTIRVWRPHSVQEKLCRHVFYGHSGAVSCMTMVHDKLWSGSHDGHVKVWDLVALECVNDLDRHSVALVALVATADNCVWSAAVDGTVLLWNGRTQQMVRQIAAMSTGIALLRPVVAATVWTFWSCLDSGLVMAYSHEALGGAAEGPVARLDAAHAQQLQEVIHKQQQQLRDMEAAYDEARVRLLVHESRGPQTAAAASPQQQKRSLDQLTRDLESERRRVSDAESVADLAKKELSTLMEELRALRLEADTVRAERDDWMAKAAVPRAPGGDPNAADVNQVFVLQQELMAKDKQLGQAERAAQGLRAQVKELQEQDERRLVAIRNADRRHAESEGAALEAHEWARRGREAEAKAEAAMVKAAELEREVEKVSGKFVEQEEEIIRKTYEISRLQAELQKQGDGSPATLVTAKELQRTIQDMKRQREEELIEQGVRIRDLNIRLDDTVAHKEQMSKDLQFTKSLLEDRQQTIDRLKAEVDRVEGQLQADAEADFLKLELKAMEARCRGLEEQLEYRPPHPASASAATQMSPGKPPGDARAGGGDGLAQRCIREIRVLFPRLDAAGACARPEAEAELAELVNVLCNDRLQVEEEVINLATALVRRFHVDPDEGPAESLRAIHATVAALAEFADGSERWSEDLRAAQEECARAVAAAAQQSAMCKRGVRRLPPDQVDRLERSVADSTKLLGALQTRLLAMPALGEGSAAAVATATDAAPRQRQRSTSGTRNAAAPSAAAVETATDAAPRQRHRSTSGTRTAAAPSAAAVATAGGPAPRHRPRSMSGTRTAAAGERPLGSPQPEKRAVPRAGPASGASALKGAASVVKGTVDAWHAERACGSVVPDADPAVGGGERVHVDAAVLPAALAQLEPGTRVLCVVAPAGDRGPGEARSVVVEQAMGNGALEVVVQRCPEGAGPGHLRPVAGAWLRDTEIVEFAADAVPPGMALAVGQQVTCVACPPPQGQTGWWARRLLRNPWQASPDGPGPSAVVRWLPAQPAPRSSAEPAPAARADGPAKPSTKFFHSAGALGADESEAVMY